MSMTITGIATNVQALLTASGSFQDVISSPVDTTEEFSGYPSISHYYQNTGSDVATVTQNRRAIMYTVEIYDKQRADLTYSEALLQQIYPLIDSTIQIFDDSRDLSSDTIPLSRACDFLRPAPAELGVIEAEAGKVFCMTINLICEGDITFTN